MASGPDRRTFLRGAAGAAGIGALGALSTKVPYAVAKERRSEASLAASITVSVVDVAAGPPGNPPPTLEGCLSG